MTAKLGERSTLDLLKVALAESDMSPKDKQFVFAGSWTLEELPPITSAEQCEAYKELANRLAKQHWDGSDDSFVVFTRSKEGMLSNALDARIAEWEEGEQL